MVTTDFDSDYASDSGSDTDYVDLALAEERRALCGGEDPAPRVGSRPEVKRQAKHYDEDPLDELILDTTGLTIPARGGVWVPVRRRRMSERGGDEVSSSSEEERDPLSGDERQPSRMNFSEVAVPLARGPNVVPRVSGRRTRTKGCW